jgi:SAM-dependent methyltransferase
MAAMCGRPLDFKGKILVAGCGTGLEALVLGQKYPAAQIIAVDFCTRSIRKARALKKTAGRRAERVTFLRADLTDHRLFDLIGGGFEFVYCHGVLSYIPRANAVLKHFARCLDSDGIVYIGANGSRHFSARWRPALQALGINIFRYRPTQQLRRFLQIFDAIDENKKGLMSRMASDYLSSDLITPYIRNAPLSWWVEQGRHAGLHFVAEYDAFRKARMPASEKLLDVLSARSRAEIQQLVALVEPVGFHRMLFMKRRPPRPPRTRNEMLSARPTQTNLYRMTRNARREQLRLESAAANTLVEITQSRWEGPFLQAADGRRSVRQILQTLPTRVAWSDLGSGLYMLYQLGALDFSA